MCVWRWGHHFFALLALEWQSPFPIIARLQSPYKHLQTQQHRKVYMLIKAGTIRLLNFSPDVAHSLSRIVQRLQTFSIKGHCISSHSHGQVIISAQQRSHLQNGLTVNHRGSYQQHLSTTKFISKKSRVWLSGWKISEAADRELFVHPNSHQPCFQKVCHDFHCRDAAIQDALRHATSKLRSICTSRTTPLKASQPVRKLQHHQLHCQQPLWTQSDKIF